MFSEPKEQAKSEGQIQETDNWDQRNLVAVFLLLLKVDQRLNPKNYEIKTND